MTHRLRTSPLPVIGLNLLLLSFTWNRNALDFDLKSHNFEKFMLKKNYKGDVNFVHESPFFFVIGDLSIPAFFWHYQINHARPYKLGHSSLQC